MSYGLNSNFNKEANFSGVKFGENKPVLEVELNELQEIQNEARADIIRDSIPSGFTQLGELDFEYMLGAENKVKLKSDSTAYVNGYKIFIPSGTIIDIGEAPKGTPREDLLFLEVWKEEVTKDSVLTKNGGEGQVVIPNKIQDTRYPVETTRRIVLKWRIRVVPNVDFVTYPLDGFCNDVNSTVYARQYNSAISPQGSLKAPYQIPILNYRDGYGLCTDGCNKSFTGRKPVVDSGLYMAGIEGRNNFKTVDGHSYAIPMFRLYRKPSRGLAKPFEYKKINAQVDYKAFSERVKGEKVEKGEEIVIKGNTYQNAIIEQNINLNITPSTHSGHIKTISGTTPNGVYTLVVKVTKVHDSSTSLFVEGDSTNNVFEEFGRRVVTVGTNTLVLKNTSGLKNTFLIGCSGNALGFEITKSVMLIEGDHTNNPDILEYFEGITSVGEKENNKVEVVTKGKNLFKCWYESKGGHLVSTSTSSILPNGEIQCVNTSYPMIWIPLDPLKEYTLYVDARSESNNINGLSFSLAKSKVSYPADPYGKIYTTGTVPSKIIMHIIDAEGICIRSGHLTFLSNVIIVEKGTNPTYEPYKESRLTYQLDAPLRRLPNGVCDEIVGNKLIRRVGKVTFNGSENWLNQGNHNDTTMLFSERGAIFAALDKQGANNHLNSRFKDSIVYHSSITTEGAYVSSNSSDYYVRILKSKISSLDTNGFKAWLQANPITVLYELGTPTTEALTALNNEYAPVEEKSNQFTGALYYQDGVNYTKLVNSISPSALEVNTGKRVIKTDKVEITDCAYKKHYDGLELIEYGQGKNKMDNLSINRNPPDDYKRWFIIPKKTNQLIFSCTSVVSYLEVYECARENTTSLYKDWIVNKVYNYMQTGVINSCSNLNYYIIAFNMSDSNSPTEDQLKIIQVEEGTVATPFEPYVKGYTTFENVLENDVDDLRHLVSLTGFNYQSLMEQSFDKLLRGTL